MQSRLFGWLLDILFPPKCVFCRRLLRDGQKDICPDCDKILPFTAKRDVSINVQFAAKCVVPLYYEGVVRESFLRFKFQSMENYAAAYGRLMSDCIRYNLDGQFDLISWAPVSRKRKAKRGYDQSELLARELGDIFGVSVVPTLKKNRNNPQQSSITGKEKRKANVLGVYEALGADLTGRKILLIDDIITTGSTMSECARTLMTAGAEKVVCAGFARKRGM